MAKCKKCGKQLCCYNNTGYCYCHSYPKDYKPSMSVIIARIVYVNMMEGYYKRFGDYNRRTS